MGRTKPTSLAPLSSPSSVRKRRFTQRLSWRDAGEKIQWYQVFSVHRMRNAGLSRKSQKWEWAGKSIYLSNRFKEREIQGDSDAQTRRDCCGCCLWMSTSFSARQVIWVAGELRPHPASFLPISIPACHSSPWVTLGATYTHRLSLTLHSAWLGKHKSRGRTVDSESPIHRSTNRERAWLLLKQTRATAALPYLFITRIRFGKHTRLEPGAFVWMIDHLLIRGGPFV